MEKFTCIKCGELKDIEFLSAKVKNKCKECVNAEQREHRRKKKIEQDKPIEVPLPENKENKKPKKPPVKKLTKNKTDEIKQMTTGILMSGFALISIRAGEHWNLSEDEANSISSPLINILNKYGAFRKVTNNMDIILLAGAIWGTIIPRALISYDMMKLKKDNEVNDIDKIRKKKDETSRSDKRNSANGNEGNQSSHENLNKKDISTPFSL
jgi:hypothetical protein